MTLPAELTKSPGRRSVHGVPVPEEPATRTPHLPHVVGVDPSLTCTGIASSLGWLEQVGQDKVTRLPLAQRIEAVDRLAEKILTLVGAPSLVVIETPAFTRSGAGGVERHALWWLLVRAWHRREVPVAEVGARCRMRYATGKGSADKRAVVDAAARRWPEYETGGNDNLADALVLCAMGADHLGLPLAKMPAAHRAALESVTWPETARGKE